MVSTAKERDMVMSQFLWVGEEEGIEGVRAEVRRGGDAGVEASVVE